MLNGPTYTNTLAAEASILPGVSTSTREQVAREWRRLKMARTETSDIGRGHGVPLCREKREADIFFFRRSAEAQRPAGFGREKLAICSVVAGRLTTGRGA